MIFNKHYKSAEELADLIEARGLILTNKHKVISYLKNIGYYRMSGYLYPLLSFPKEEHKFKPESNFRNALDLYLFDKKLRVFLFNEIEKIEIAFRTTIANIGVEETNDMFWITNPNYFNNQQQFTKTLELINKELSCSKEDFILHFKEKYNNPYPPAWILIEILPMGVVNHIFNNIANNQLRKRIARRFNLPLPVFSSWETIIILIRNACCHHARIWNKENAIIPAIAKRMNRPWINTFVPTNKIYFDICILKYFIDIISPNNNLKKHLEDLLLQFPSVDIAAMGFPKNWKEEPLWT